MSNTYSNAEKLMAVVETWSRPLIAQLPPPYSYLAPAIGSMMQSFLSRVPDDTLPSVANDIIDNAVSNGSIKLWNITLDKSDLTELQKLIRLNLPCEKKKPIGYEVKIK